MYEYDELKFRQHVEDSNIDWHDAVYGLKSGENELLMAWNGPPSRYTVSQAGVAEFAGALRFEPIRGYFNEIVLVHDPGPSHDRGTVEDYGALGSKLAERATAAVTVVDARLAATWGKAVDGRMLVVLGHGACLLDADLLDGAMCIDPPAEVSELSQFVGREGVEYQREALRLIPVGLEGFMNILSLRSGELALQAIVKKIVQGRLTAASNK